MADVTVAKLGRHLWYTNEILVGLAFFDDEVSVEVKRRMVKALTMEANGVYRPVVPAGNFQQYASRDMSTFVTAGTLELFRCFKLESRWVQEIDPELWPSLPPYKKAKEVLREVLVVNDPAERGVAMAKRVNNILTTKEDRKQAVCKVIQYHISKFEKV